MRATGEEEQEQRSSRWGEPAMIVTSSPQSRRRRPEKSPARGRPNSDGEVPLQERRDSEGICEAERVTSPRRLIPGRRPE